VSDDLAALFLRHVCQTSAAPLGIEVARAAGSTVWDARGRTYLDLLAGMGVANVGHTHPEVVAAVRAQAERHLHVMVYGEFVQEAQVRLATRLAGLLAPPLAVVYFTSSGAEAIEGALKTARKHTRRVRIVAFEGGFHGDTLGALSIGGNPLYRAPFEPLLPEVKFLPFDDEAAFAAIDAHTAAVVVEPVQAEAGVRVPSPAFLPALQLLTGFGFLLMVSMRDPLRDTLEFHKFAIGRLRAEHGPHKRDHPGREPVPVTVEHTHFGLEKRCAQDIFARREKA